MGFFLHVAVLWC